jgi:hypothetical protein
MPARWAESGLADFRGTVRCRRRFGYPGRIDAHERVWLTLAGLSDRGEVRLNDHDLGSVQGAGPFEFEVTPLLASRNELVIDVTGSSEEGGGLWGEVALEVRCSAYLREVRLWLEQTGEGVVLHATGQVVGTAERELELYAVLDRSTVAYATVMPRQDSPVPFHLVGDAVKGKCARIVKIDLVNGGVVWYTVQEELPTECAS